MSQQQFLKIWTFVFMIGGSFALLFFISITLPTIATTSYAGTPMKDYGHKFKVVHRSTHSGSQLEGLRHYKVLLFRGKDLGQVGFVSISPSGQWALYEQKGRIMLFMTKTIKSFDITDGNFAVPRSVDWNESKRIAIIEYYDDHPLTHVTLLTSEYMAGGNSKMSSESLSRIFLSTKFDMITQWREIMPGVKAALENLMIKDRKIVDAEASFNPSDVRGDHLPSRRFILGGRSLRFWFVCYEKGGVGKYSNLVLFDIDGKRAKPIWAVSLVSKIDNFEKIKEQILKGQIVSRDVNKPSAVF